MSFSETTPSDGTDATPDNPHAVQILTRIADLVSFPPDERTGEAYAEYRYAAHSAIEKAWRDPAMELGFKDQGASKVDMHVAIDDDQAAGLRPLTILAAIRGAELVAGKTSDQGGTGNV